MNKKQYIFIAFSLLIAAGFAVTFPHAAHADITFDASSSVGFTATIVTSTITVGNGANEALIIAIADGGATSTGVSVDGVAATEAGFVPTASRNTAIWYIENLAAGLHTISSTFAANKSVALAAESFFGVNQATPVEVTSTANKTSATPSSSITTLTAGDWIVDATAYNNTATTTAAGPGQIIVAQNIGSGSSDGSFSYKIDGSTGATSTSWTLSSSQNWTMTVAALKPATNPTPSTTALSPTSTTAGGSQFTLTVSGSNFATDATVDWNGSPRTTTFVSSSSLTAIINASDIVSSGTASVTVVNPIPGGGTSNAQTFTINAAIACPTNNCWTGGGADNNWNTTGNWSAGAVPTSTATVTFNGNGANGTKNCTINAAVNVAGLSITSGYTGTITQNSGKTVTVGSSGYSQAAGTFTGTAGNSAISVSGLFSLTGGTFTSTAGTLTLGASSTFAGTFNNNSGTVMFISTSTSATVTGSTTFYGLSLGYGNNNAAFLNYPFTVATGTVLTINNTTTFNVYYADIYFEGGGEIDVKGNMLLTGLEYNAAPSSTFNLVLNGAGTQTINDQDNTSLLDSDFFFLPSLTVNKPSGSVNLIGNIAVTGNFTNQNGPSAFSAGTSTMLFYTTSTVTIAGSSTFYNLWLGTGTSANQGTSTFIIATGTTLAATGQLYFDVNQDAITLLGGGELDAQGNIEGTFNQPYSTITPTVVVDGAGSQTIGDQSACATLDLAGDCNGVFMHNLTITKASGSVTFQNTIAIGGNFTNTNSTAINPGTSTILFGQGYFVISGVPGNIQTYTITGSSTFNNFLVGNYSSGLSSTIVTIATGTTITAQGYFAMYHTDTGSYDQFLGGGQVDLQGDVAGETGVTPAFPTSTVQFVLDGTSTQILGNTQSCPSCTYASLPNLTVAKPSGVAYVENTVQVGGSTTISQGELSLATTSAVSSAEFDGPFMVNSGAILSDYSLATSTLKFGSQVTNNGLVFFDGSGEGCTVTLPNEVIINSTTTGSQIPWSGSGNFVMRYVKVKDQGGTSTISDWNGSKSGGDVGGNWSFPSEPEVQLVQSSNASGGSGTNSVTLPAFGFKPRTGDLVLVAVSAKNQTIAAPTDNASNTYQLIASTTFGSSPSYALSLYYAKNIVSTSSFTVTANGNGGSGQFLSASAFEYTGIAPSSTLDATSSNTGTGTALTSLSAAANDASELYFGLTTFSASTTLTSAAGWNSESGVMNNNTLQALYVEDIGTSTAITTSAVWTAATTTSYGAIIATLRSPYLAAYQTSGSIDSATFDTGVASGSEINSVTWNGSAPGGSSVYFQFAVNNSSSGPWNYEGPDGSVGTFFGPVSPGVAQSLVSSVGGKGYGLFAGYRYFRYRITMYSDGTHAYTPTVNQVIVNWSP